MIIIKYEWIGKYIRFHRERKKLTRDKLAELSGIEPSTITSGELQNNGLSFNSIIALLNALELDFNNCYNISNEKIILKEEIKQKISFSEFLDNDDYLFLLEIINSLNSTNIEVK